MARTRAPHTFLFVLVASCAPDFDESGKITCETNRDCLPGRLCLWSEERGGVCVNATDLRDDMGTGGSDAPGDSAGDPPVADAGPDASTDATEHDSAPRCLDEDGDGAFTTRECGPWDCDDDLVAVSPFAAEICNGRDDDCDGLRDETFDFRSDRDNCGVCGNRCHAPNALNECVASACTVSGCAPGYRDGNDRLIDGCDIRCDSREEACSDGSDNDCDGRADAEDADCQEPADPLANRRWFTLEWIADGDDAGFPAVVTGEFRTGVDPRVGTWSRRVQAAAGLPQRGGSLPDLACGVAEESASALRVTDPEGHVYGLRRAAGSDDNFLAGVSASDFGADRMVVFIALDVAQTGAAAPEHLSWLTNPLAESDAPPGGMGMLPWDEPVELSQLFLGSATPPTWGTTIWPFSEYRDSVLGEVDGDESLAPMRYARRTDGTFLMEAFDDDGAVRLSEYFGAMTRDGAVFVGTHRLDNALCEGRALVDGRCIHDPIVMATVARSPDARVDWLAGSWRLVGVFYSAAFLFGGIDAEFVDADLRVSGATVSGSTITGTASTFNAGNAYVPGTLRIDIDGLRFFRHVTLEGHVNPGRQFGVFWDQEPIDRRPLNGSLLFLVRQPS